MADELEPIHDSEKPEGEKKDNPYNIQSHPEQEDQELQAADISPTTHPLDQSADLDIVKAKLGVERFKATYESGDDEWKHLLTETILGEELQAMYLGLKPVFTTDDTEVNAEHARQLFMRNAGQDFNTYVGFVYNASLVERVVAAHPDVFPDYVPGEMSGHQYIRRIYNLQKSQPAATPLYLTQLGLLFGYSPHAVEQFAKYEDARKQVEAYRHTAESITPEDEVVLDGLIQGGSEQPDTMEELNDNINQYVAENQQEIRVVLNKLFPTMEDDEKQYILTKRGIRLPGFFYLSGNPTSEDKTFERKVRDIFEQSGMNAYLVSLNPGSSPRPSVS